MELEAFRRVGRQDLLVYEGHVFPLASLTSGFDVVDIFVRGPVSDVLFRNGFVGFAVFL